MPLKDLILAFDDVGYMPRTLDLKLPADLASELSLHGREFLNIISRGKPNLTLVELTSDEWTKDEFATQFFWSGTEEERLEILSFLTVFIHELTHRIDFLITPFGLHYYANTLREYWRVQEFLPPILDDAAEIERLQFLVAFDENGDAATDTPGLWAPLKEIIHLFYAWGDAGNVRPLGKYIKEGWGQEFAGPVDPFGMGVPLEPVTLLDMFETFRAPGRDRLWYLRPLTIFETRAVVNSLLFIQHLLGDEAGPECQKYFERLYLARNDQLPRDYFFLLDLGAAIYGQPDFQTPLQRAPPVMIRSTLLMLSSICWFALQASPPLKGEDPRVANPIMRLLLAFNFLAAFVRGKLNVAFNSTSEILLAIDTSKLAAAFRVKPINDTLQACVRIIDNMNELNEVRTWNPKVRSHFSHIFKLMRPHFADRAPSYVSFIGMPDSGNPLLGCSTQDDWELSYDDYETPADVREWFELRTDLFFTLIKPDEAFVDRLNKHFLAFLVPYQCKCQQGMTTQWVSRFAQSLTLRCSFCGKSETVDREEMTRIGLAGTS